MKVLIYGTGTMGTGIAQTFAQADHQVYLFNPNVESANKAQMNIQKAFDRLVLKEKLTIEMREKFLNNISVLESLAANFDVDLVIEAVSEVMEIKKAKFAEVDKIVNENAILATNTSSLSITELALVTKRPEKVVGLHFFNPAPVMELVEIINGMTTSQATLEKVQELTLDLGKKPVLVDEAPGFIVNRMLIPMINEAVSIYSEGIASKEDIDTAMRCGANHPIGPLALADLIGIDVCLSIMDVLHAEFGLDKYSAHPLLRKMVRASKLGRKTKEGFYNY